MNTKKAKRVSESKTDGLKPEYSFDYSKARPNRFVGHLSDDRMLVLLDADVSKAFSCPEEVNTVLRAIITAMPKAKPKRRSKVQG